jgi:hypothetical protein
MLTADEKLKNKVAGSRQANRVLLLTDFMEKNCIK